MKLIGGDIIEQACLRRGILVQQVNCRGVMGLGLAAQVAKRWPFVRKMYVDMVNHYEYNRNALLGEVLCCHDNKDSVVIMNLFAQDRYGKEGCFTDYTALEKCLSRIAEARLAAKMGESQLWGRDVLIPFGLGCGYGGGDWPTVTSLIERYVPDAILVRRGQKAGG